MGFDTNENFNNNMKKLIAKLLFKVDNFIYRTFGVVTIIHRAYNEALQKELDRVHTMRDNSNWLFKNDYTSKKAIEVLKTNNRK